MDNVLMVASTHEMHDDNSEDCQVVAACPIYLLLLSSLDLDIETVKKGSAFFTLFGQEHHVEILLWSGTNLLNSGKGQRKSISKSACCKEEVEGWLTKNEQNCFFLTSKCFTTVEGKDSEQKSGQIRNMVTKDNMVKDVVEEDVETSVVAKAIEV